MRKLQEQKLVQNSAVEKRQHGQKPVLVLVLHDTTHQK